MFQKKRELVRRGSKQQQPERLNIDEPISPGTEGNQREDNTRRPFVTRRPGTGRRREDQLRDRLVAKFHKWQLEEEEFRDQCRASQVYSELLRTFIDWRDIGLWANAQMDRCYAYSQWQDFLIFMLHCSEMGEACRDAILH